LWLFLLQVLISSLFYSAKTHRYNNNQTQNWDEGVPQVDVVKVAIWQCVCAYILVETLAIMNGGSPRWIRGGSLKSHSLVSHVSHSFVVVGVYNSL
jgi:hypothetical protein